MSWKNPEHLELLQKLRTKGLSSSQIAKQINATFADASYTRNAIIGKLSRLGLVMSEGAQHATNVFKNRRNASVPLIIVGNGGVVEKPAGQASPYSVNPQAWAPLPGVEPVAFIALKPIHCRWPIGDVADADMLCCGAVKLSGSYCPTHTRKSVNPSQPRQLKPSDLERATRRHRRAA